MRASRSSAGRLWAHPETKTVEGMSDAVAADDSVTVPREYYYRDKETSDVVFMIGEDKIHAHRSFLATRSTTFKEIFSAYESSAKNEKVWIPLEEDPEHIISMMNMLYEQRFKSEPMICDVYNDINDEGIVREVKETWVWFSSEVKIAEKFGVIDIVRPIIEGYFSLVNCGDATCLGCAPFNLIAFYFNWNNIIKRSKTSEDTLISVLTLLSTDADIDLPQFHIAPAVLSNMLDGKVSRGNGAQSWAKEVTIPMKEELESVINYEQEKCVPSDVTLVIGNTEFRVHKQFLALYSPVFTAMFFGSYDEATKDRLEIYVDATAFKDVMDVLYNNSIEDTVSFLSCSNNNKYWEHVTLFWKRMPDIMQLFDFYNLPYRFIEDLLLSKWCSKHDCLECANKRIFGMHYNLRSVANRISNPKTIATCLRKFHDLLPVPLKLTPAELIDLISALKKPVPTKSDTEQPRRYKNWN